MESCKRNISETVNKKGGGGGGNKNDLSMEKGLETREKRAILGGRSMWAIN